MSKWSTRASWVFLLLWLAQAVYTLYICDGSKILFTEIVCIKDE